MELANLILRIGYFLLCAGVGVLLAFLLIKLKKIFDRLDIIDHQMMLDNNHIMDDLQNIGVRVEIIKENTDKKE